MNAFRKQKVRCSLCGSTTKAIIKTVIKLNICGDCEIPTRAEHEAHFYKYNKATDLNSHIENRQYESGTSIDVIKRTHDRL